MNSDRRLVQIVTGCAVAVVLLHLVFAFWRIPMGWGVHCLAFFPAWVSVGATALSLLLLMPAVSKGALGMISELRVPEIRLPLSRVRILRYAMVSLFALVPLYTFRVRVPTLGDGPMLVHELTKPTGQYFREPLTIVAVRFLYHCVGGSGETDALLAYRILSWSSGALFVFISLLVSDAAARDDRERTVMRVFLLTVGTMELFCGYVENYALLSVALLLYLYTAWNCLADNGMILMPSLVLCVAFPLHFSSAALLPSLGYLLWLEWRKKPSIFRYSIQLAVFPILTLFILQLVGFNLGDFQKEIGQEPSTVPFWTPEPFYRPHTLLSATHIVDVLNQYLLVAPMAIPVIVGTLLSAKGRPLLEPQTVFLATVAGSYALFTFFMNPLLGAFRDWDLLSPAAIPLVLLTAYLLIRHTTSETQVRTAWVFSVVALFHLIPWLWTNADADRSLARSSAILKDGSRLSTYVWGEGNEELRGIYEKLGRKKEALEAAKNALRAQPGRPWLLMNVIRLMSASGERAKVEIVLRETIGRYPELANARQFLANLYLERGDLDAAIEGYREVIQGAPKYTHAYYNLGIAMERKGNLDGAIEAYRQTAKADSHFVNAYYSLAIVQTTRGDTADAVASYRDYIRLCGDEPWKQQARRMIRQLGGVP